MREPFKNFLNDIVISNMGEHLKKAWPEFNRTGFVTMATKSLKTLELKQRSIQITEALAVFLPDNFEKTASVMLASLAPEDGYEIDVNKDKRGIVGWAVMPMVDYVGLHGIENFDTSMHLFKEMTKRSSSEFGIRYFLIAEPERTVTVLNSWINDPNHHVRRLISEGTRTRLPWAMRLPVFIDDPMPVINLLEKLKDDKEEYVRRSVANNLNDIAKDHPDTVAELSRQWMKGASKERQRLVKHGCRTLIKNGHKKTLEVLGFNPPKIHKANIKILTPKVIFGDKLQFTFSIRSDSEKIQALIVDYIIHHQKANGKTTPKVFKWRTVNLSPKETLTQSKNHNIKKITTRVYYAGAHAVEIMVNGVSMGKANFQLVMPK